MASGIGAIELFGPFLKNGETVNLYEEPKDGSSVDRACAIKLKAFLKENHYLSEWCDNGWNETGEL
jgi:hypothetical protein